MVGHCQCDRLCTADTPCGTDDGCGGRCLGPCANPFAVCDPVLYSCDCTRTCAPDSTCGEDDGCGGRCDQGCALGERCDTARRICICVTICPPPERFSDTPCGQFVNNLCTGGPPCGIGTGCPDGQRCNATTRACECVRDCGSMGMDAGPPSVPDGGGGGGLDASMDVACPGGSTVCAGRCVNLREDSNHCGSCDSPCPFAPPAWRACACARRR